MTRRTLSSWFPERSKYSEYFLTWYFFIQAKAIASMIRTVKTPPKKTPADEEEVVGVSGQLPGGLLMAEVVLHLWTMADGRLADGHTFLLIMAVLLCEGWFGVLVLSASDDAEVVLLLVREALTLVLKPLATISGRTGVLV